eukprot:CAMPEP_0114237714 /NCGR_PEP_ID=MMETSP0058-20121206/7537_1 /TAXON_ID=36894 /ORGANISM="Pyramimonas parkeae, CCMP726" /LENGTH=222 /DNA_ID=CAMNT_0001349773 /DNA_START=429 /DNA_END=1097 /DNA_ORIENTATION=+
MKSFDVWDSHGMRVSKADQRKARHTEVSSMPRRHDGAREMVTLLMPSLTSSQLEGIPQEDVQLLRDQPAAAAAQLVRLREMLPQADVARIFLHNPRAALQMDVPELSLEAEKMRVALLPVDVDAYFDARPELLQLLPLLEAVSAKELLRRTTSLRKQLNPEQTALAVVDHVQLLCAPRDKWPANRRYLVALLQGDAARQLRSRPWQLLPRKRTHRRKLSFTI